MVFTLTACHVGGCIYASSRVMLRMGSRRAVPFALGVATGVGAVALLDSWRDDNGHKYIKQPLFNQHVTSEETDYASKYFK